jgi:hypothetical protein
MTDELTHKLTDSVKHCNTETLEREITTLRWALKTKQNVIDRLLKEQGLADEEREALKQAAIRVEALCQRGSQRMATTLRNLLERLSKQNPSPSQ